VGARMVQLAANRAVVAEALAAGLGGADMTAIADLLRVGPPADAPPTRKGYDAGGLARGR
jgi:hypothetical protein